MMVEDLYRQVIESWNSRNADAMAELVSSQDEVRAFLRDFGAIDLAGVRFPNPFVRGVRFSLATGLHVIAAHALVQRRLLRTSLTFARASPSGA